MTHDWDEFSKSLAEADLPRRESLRRLGFLFAGAVLSPLGAGTAWARGADPCKIFCNQCPKSQRNNCLAVCNACNSDTGRLAGACGNFTCCAVAACNGVCSDLTSDPNCGACGNDCTQWGDTCCGGHYCANLASDFYNCGACWNRCNAPGPYEVAACVEGECRYACAEGAVVCDGRCSLLDQDPSNCGECGNVCAGAAPYCVQGECTCPEGLEVCGERCVDLNWDNANCGACGVQCTYGYICWGGICEVDYPSDYLSEYYNQGGW
jgi:hypothetical protein